MDSKINSPTKTPEISTITHDENEEMSYQLSKLEAKLNEVNDRLVTHTQFINQNNDIESEMKKLATKDDLKVIKKIELDEEFPSS